MAQFHHESVSSKRATNGSVGSSTSVQQCHSIACNDSPHTMTAKKNSAKKTQSGKPKTVATLRHDAKRKNLPTVEYQSLMREADKSPIQVAYERRNRDLDPQFVWRGDPKLAPVLQDDSRYMPSR